MLDEFFEWIGKRLAINGVKASAKAAAKEAFVAAEEAGVKTAAREAATQPTNIIYHQFSETTFHVAQEATEKLGEEAVKETAKAVEPAALKKLVKDKVISSGTADLLKNKTADEVTEFIAKAGKSAGGDMSAKALAKAMKSTTLWQKTCSTFKTAVVGVAGWFCYKGYKEVSSLGQQAEDHGGAAQLIKDKIAGTQGRFTVENHPDGTQHIIRKNDNGSLEDIFNSKDKAEVVQKLKELGGEDKGILNEMGDNFKNHPWMMAGAGVGLIMGMGASVGDIISSIPFPGTQAIGRMLSKLGDNKLTKAAGFLLIIGAVMSGIGMGPDKIIAAVTGHKQDPNTSQTASAAPQLTDSQRQAATALALSKLQEPTSATRQSESMPGAVSAATLRSSPSRTYAQASAPAGPNI